MSEVGYAAATNEFSDRYETTVASIGSGIYPLLFYVGVLFGQSLVD